MIQDVDEKAAAMPTKGRLTKAQLSVLRTLRRRPSYHIAGEPQVRALERPGYVSTNEHRSTAITPSGLAALSEADPLPEIKGIAAT